MRCGGCWGYRSSTGEHVQSPDYEGNYWLQPDISLAHNHGLKRSALIASLNLIKDHEQEIRRAWQAHFGR